MILKKEPYPSFSRKTIYQMHSALDSKKWHHDNNELVSSRVVIQESLAGLDPGLSSAQPIPLPEEPGILAIAFCLPHIIKKWDTWIREIAMDSTCEFLILSFMPVLIIY